MDPSGNYAEALNLLDDILDWISNPSASDITALGIFARMFSLYSSSAKAFGGFDSLAAAMAEQELKKVDTAKAIRIPYAKSIVWTKEMEKDASLNGVYYLANVAEDFQIDYSRSYTFAEAYAGLLITGTYNSSWTQSDREIQNYIGDYIYGPDTAVFGMWTQEQAHAYALARAVAGREGLDTENGVEVLEHHRKSPLQPGIYLNHYHVTRTNPSLKMHVWFGNPV